MAAGRPEKTGETPREILRASEGEREKIVFHREGFPGEKTDQREMIKAGEEP